MYSMQALSKLNRWNHSNVLWNNLMHEMTNGILLSPLELFLKKMSVLRNLFYSLIRIRLTHNPL